MTHDKFTAIASLTAVFGLLSLSAVVSAGRRPLPPKASASKPSAQLHTAPTRQSMLAVGLIPVADPVELLLEPEPQSAASETNKLALVTPLNLFSVGRCLEQAETENDLQAARECIADQLGHQVPSSYELGQWICSLGEGRLSQAQVMLEVLLPRVPGDGLLSYAEQVQDNCPAIEGEGLLARAMLAALAGDSERRQRFAGLLSPAQLYNPLASTLALELAQQLALEGNGSARSLIEEGAAGLHGGSEAQILGAASMGLELQTDAGEAIAYLTGIVESPFTPGERAMGSLLADALLDPEHWNGSDPSTAVGLLNRILADERFRLSAGRALVGRLDAAPIGASERAWGQLLESESFRHLREQVLMVAPD